MEHWHRRCRDQHLRRARALSGVQKGRYKARETESFYDLPAAGEGERSNSGLETQDQYYLLSNPKHLSPEPYLPRADDRHLLGLARLEVGDDASDQAWCWV